MRIVSVEQLADLVRDQRKRQKISQAELAAKTGVSRQWVVGFEAGRTNPDFQTLVRLLEALGIQVNLMQSDSIAPSGEPSLDDVLNRLKKRTD